MTNAATIFFVMLALSPQRSGGAGADAGADALPVDLAHLDTIPAPDHPTLYDICQDQIAHAGCRVMVAEAMEQEGRFADALRWAAADVQVGQRALATELQLFT